MFNINIEKLFKRKPKGEVIRVKSHRDTQLRNEAGELVLVREGDEINTTLESLSDMQAGEDFTRLYPHGQPALPSLPPRTAPAVMPDSWRALPACFGEFWDLQEKFSCAFNHVDIIEAARDRHFPGTLSYEHLARYGRSATDFYNSLCTTYGTKFSQLWLRCGQEQINACAELKKVVLEVKQTGRRIFAQRLAALELHPDKIASLYEGSVCHQTYETLAEPSVDLLLGSYDMETGVAEVYTDDPPEASATRILNFNAQMAVAKKLLAEAKAELAKASKVA